MSSRTEDSFAQDTRILVDASIQSALRGQVAVPEALDRRLRPIVRAVFEAGRNNREAFELMCGHLDLDTASVYVSVQSILGSIFADDKINVGRIISLLAFGGHLADYCKRNLQLEVVTGLSSWMASFFSVRLETWIVQNGGWVSKLCSGVA